MGTDAVTAVLFNRDNQWGVAISTGADTEWLPGFASWFDAWAFCVAATNIDPLRTLPAWTKLKTKQPQPDTLYSDGGPVQYGLFSEVVQC